MKKIAISKEELELMNYNDIAYLILKENGKKMKIIDLFNEVGKLLGLNPDEFQSHITDFFELLSTDKRFIMLEEGYWDLRIKHDKGMVIEAEEDEEDEDIVLEDEENSESDVYDEDEEKDADSDDDVEEDDLSDLVIIDDTDEENI